MNVSKCLDGYNTDLIGTELFALVMLVIIVLGNFFNLIVITLLITQSRMSNQDLYILALSISGLVMISPCFTVFLYLTWANCPTIPAIARDFLFFGVQVVAGVDVWLTCCVTIDRLLMVIYHIHYPSRETRRRVLTKILVILAVHTVLCLFPNFAQYSPAFAKRPQSPLDIPDGLRLKPVTIPEVVSAEKCLNVFRLLLDRLAPWALCPAVYATVFALRRRRRLVAHRSDVGDDRARQKAEFRVIRSRRMVIGITLTMVICSFPETVLDASWLLFGYDMRANTPGLLSLLWYLPAIIDPLICLISVRNLNERLRSTFSAVTKRFGNAEKLICSVS